MDRTYYSGYIRALIIDHFLFTKTERQNGGGGGLPNRIVIA